MPPPLFAQSGPSGKSRAFATFRKGPMPLESTALPISHATRTSRCRAELHGLDKGLLEQRITGELDVLGRSRRCSMAVIADATPLNPGSGLAGSPASLAARNGGAARRLRSRYSRKDWPDSSGFRRWEWMPLVSSSAGLRKEGISVCQPRRQQLEAWTL
jgi:hypothetical protein